MPVEIDPYYVCSQCFEEACADDCERYAKRYGDLQLHTMFAIRDDQELNFSRAVTGLYRALDLTKDKLTELKEVLARPT